ncbi:perilipin 6 [Lycodopsis pacificus]
MGFGEGEMSERQHHETSAVLRVSALPLVSSALQSMTSAYSEVTGRYPLLRLIGGVAEGVSSVAMTRATPLLQRLEPQIEVANSFVVVGLDRLEKNFPILNQSTEELGSSAAAPPRPQVLAHLKAAVQLWVVEALDGALDQLEHLSGGAVMAVRLLRDSQGGRVAASGLDDVLSRLEDATARYLPLPPTLRRQWEMKVQEYEDEDEDEPGLWTRIRSLLLNLSLQLYHRLMKVREQLEDAVGTLGDAADQVGLGKVLELVGELLRYLQGLLMVLVYRAESLRELTLSGVRGQAVMLTELLPVRRIRELPVQIQQLLGDLQELAKILLQLVINATPLYTMLQQPSAQEVEDFLSQEDITPDSSSRRGSASSLFLKAMDGRPRRRRSLYSRATAGRGGPQSPDPPNGRRRSSVKDLPAPEAEEDLKIPSNVGSVVHRRPSATELLLAPLKQFVSQSQKAFEYLSPNSLDDATEEDDDS